MKMDTNKNSYTLLYATGMVVIVALLLALVSGALKSRQVTNEELDKKKQILSALNVIEAKDFEETYDQYITAAYILNSNGEVISKDKDEAFKVNVAKEAAKALDKRQLPVYIAQIDGETKYILSTRGAGLWGAVWGYVALNQDKNTIYGSYFSHESETPGLGAEISTKPFQNEFIGKKIMNEAGDFVSVAIVKPGNTISDRDYVDGISGGTITCQGVEDMLLNSLGQYENFMKQSKEEETDNE